MNCPACGSSMKIRIAGSGSYKGRRFWGCSRFPECRMIVDIDSSNEASLERINDHQHSQIANKPYIKRPSVEVGSKVKIQFLNTGEISEFTIFRLEREEIRRTGNPYIQYQEPEYLVLNPAKTGQLSDESALGKALIGKSEGEVTKCVSKDGSYAIKILNILDEVYL